MNTNTYLNTNRVLQNILLILLLLAMFITGVQIVSADPAWVDPSTQSYTSPYPKSLYIAQNDPASIQVVNDHGSCWIFPFSEKLEQTKLYDMPSGRIGNSSYCSLTSTQTANMKEGTYTLIYVYPATVNRKYMKDISWKDEKLVSIFSSVEPVNENGRQASMVLSDLKNMLKGSTDKSEEYRIEIQAPIIEVSRIEGVTDVIIRITGTSNLKDKTPVTIKVDEWDHYAKGDSKTFTFNTVVVREGYSSIGNWSKDMQLPLQNMAPGWHDVTYYSGGLSGSTRFPIYQTWEPVPTPTQYINYFGNGTIKPDVVTVVKIEKVIETKEIFIQLTATPTPDITDALGDKITYPYEKGESIPSYIGVILLLCLCGIVLTRGWVKR